MTVLTINARYGVAYGSDPKAPFAWFGSLRDAYYFRGTVEHDAGEPIIIIEF